MWKVMTDELQSEITRQEKELNSRADVTDKMMETRIQRYQEIKNKVEMYETVLNGTASEMKEQLAKLTDTVRAKLVEE
jgi:iron uptake system EfeUOB component EfeO/EfeM